jgi:hypothetical protein
MVNQMFGRETGKQSNLHHLCLTFASFPLYKTDFFIGWWWRHVTAISPPRGHRFHIDPSSFVSQLSTPHIATNSADHLRRIWQTTCNELGRPPARMPQWQSHALSPPPSPTDLAVHLCERNFKQRQIRPRVDRFTLGSFAVHWPLSDCVLSSAKAHAELVISLWGFRK